MEILNFSTIILVFYNDTDITMIVLVREHIFRLDYRETEG